MEREIDLKRLRPDRAVLGSQCFIGARGGSLRGSNKTMQTVSTVCGNI